MPGSDTPGAVGNWPVQSEGSLRQPDRLVQVCGAGGDFNAVQGEPLGQSADLVALIEDGLQGGVGLGEQVFPLVGVREELRALKAPEELGFGDVGRGRIVGCTFIGRYAAWHNGRVPRSGSEVTADLAITGRACARATNPPDRPAGPGPNALCPQPATASPRSFP